MALPDGTTDPSYESRFLTSGAWETEEASAEAFDQAVVPSELFHIYREVAGVLTQPRPEQVSKTMRIDRVLVPGPILVRAGWGYGAVGVEIKRSGIKLGPPLAQAMDYTRGAWSVKGVLMHLGAVFLWSCEEQFGPLASLMIHNRVGSISTSRWVRAHFRLGGETVLRIEHDGRWVSRFTGEPMIGNGRSGHKVGSR